MQSTTSSAVSATTNGMNQIVVAVMSGGTRAAAAARSSAVAIRSAYTSVNLSSAGAHMMNGLISGINARRGAVIAAAQSVAAAAASAVNGALKIHSPSRVMMETGRYVDEGLIKGIEYRKDAVSAAATANLANPVKETSNNLRGSSISVPTITNQRSSIIGETIDAYTSDKKDSDNNQPGTADGIPQIIYNPVYHFDGEAPSKEDIVEANRMSQSEFEKMMKEYIRKHGRIVFA